MTSSTTPMPQDHYIARTYLRGFAEPGTRGRLHAYWKSDGRYFATSPNAICKTMDWDLNPKFLAPADALGRWLKIFEPYWAGAVDRLATSHFLSHPDKYLIAGYRAYLSTCTPTYHRIATDIQQAALDDIHLPRFLDHVRTHPDKFPRAADYIPLVEAGSLKAEIDPGYAKAVVTKQLQLHQWHLYHEQWDIVWNDTGELFVTSDNPSCFDYQHGDALRSGRFLPLTPRLALWTRPEFRNLPKIGANVPPLSGSTGRKATVKFVREMNRLVIQSAENIVVASAPVLFIAACVTKYRDWRVRTVKVTENPTADGHYELTQTRAAPAR